MTRELFKDAKSRKQIAMYYRHRNMCTDAANARGLARWKQRNHNGAWEYQNLIENFPEDEECLSVE